MAGEYRRQLQWRDWQTILDALPPLQGQTVIDLGCGVGDVASELAARGADVVGVDANEELLQHARSRQIPNVDFRAVDLRGPVEFGVAADGLWCSFTAAYFVDFSVAVRSWAENLKSGGWIAVTEIDDLFGHEPLSARTAALLNAYCDDALAAKRYDFRAGRKLDGHLEDAGFSVTKLLALNDRELSFHGPADGGILDAWRARFERMRLLQDFLGVEFEPVREEFLGCLTIGRLQKFIPASVSKRAFQFEYLWARLPKSSVEISAMTVGLQHGATGACSGDRGRVTGNSSFGSGHHRSAVREGRRGWQRSWAKESRAFRKRCCGCLT